MRNVHSGALLVLAMILVLGLAGVGLAEESKGKLKAILADKETFVMTDKDGNDYAFKLADMAKVLIDDREGKLADLRSGDNLAVTWEERDGRRMASLITCKKE